MLRTVMSFAQGRGLRRAGLGVRRYTTACGYSHCNSSNDIEYRVVRISALLVS